jgi:pyruvate,orthophosphate dikinase
MIASQGVLTSEGGATSHAAVVARQFGIPCVVGASAIKIDLERRQMTVGEPSSRKAIGFQWMAPQAGLLGKIPTSG